MTSFDVPLHKPCNRKEEQLHVHVHVLGCFTEHTKALADEMKKQQALGHPILILSEGEIC